MQDHVTLARAFAARDVATAVEIMSDHILPMLESSP
jgi:DNA-binding GntR family transcriptional regulator